MAVGDKRMLQQTRRSTNLAVLNKFPVCKTEFQKSIRLQETVYISKSMCHPLEISKSSFVVPVIATNEKWRDDLKTCYTQNSYFKQLLFSNNTIIPADIYYKQQNISV